LKISGRLGSRLVLLYCHCFHAVNFSARRTRGLSQPGHDDEQGADYADEDQRSETDPHPARASGVSTSFAVWPPVSHVMRGQYIAVRLRPRFVTRPRKNAVLDRRALTFVGRSSDFSQVFRFGPGAAKTWRGGIRLRWGARFVRFLFRKPRQFEPATVSAETICVPQRLIRTSGSAFAQNQFA
jgi:hypothetical protein